MALLAFWAFAENLEDLIEALDLAFCLLEMTFKGTSQLLRYSGPSQLRQGLRDLFLRGIEIFLFVQQEFIDGIYAHVCSFPYNRVLADLARDQSGTSALGSCDA